MSQSHQSPSGQVRFFMVTTDCMAVKLPSSKTYSKQEKGISQGTLLMEEVVTNRNERFAAFHKQRQVVVKIFAPDCPGIYVVDLNKLISVTEDEALVLRTVLPSRSRTTKFTDKAFMNEMMSIGEGSKVLVYENEFNSWPGVVLNKGFEPSNGIVVEVQAFRNGDSNEFPTNNPVPFGNPATVPLDTVRLMKDPPNDYSPTAPSFNLGSKVQQRLTGGSKNQTGSTKVVHDDFVLNERVVWVRNGQHDSGHVCYLGCPNPNSKEGHCVGVKFDKQIKTSRGELVEVHFFTTSKGKKGLYPPISELKREKDINLAVKKEKDINLAVKKEKDINPPSYDSSKYSPSQTKKKLEVKSKTTFYDSNDHECGNGKASPAEKNPLKATNTDSKFSYQVKEKKSYDNVPAPNQGSPQSPISKNNLSDVDVFPPTPPKTQKPLTTSPLPIEASAYQRQTSLPRDGFTPTQLPGSRRIEQSPSPHVSHVILRKTSSGSSESSPGVKRPSPSPPVRKRSEKDTTPDYAEVGRKNSSNAERIKKQNVEPIKNGVHTRSQSGLNHQAPEATRIQDHDFDGMTKINKQIQDEIEQLKQRSPEFDPTARNQNIHVRGNSTTYNFTRDDKTSEEDRMVLYMAERKSGKNQSISQKSRDAVMSYEPNQVENNFMDTLAESPDDYYHVEHDDCGASEAHEGYEPCDSLTELEKHLSLTEFRKNYLFENANDLDVGSMVEVEIRQEPWYGVIRWKGHIEETPKPLALVEMEKENDCFNDGTLNGKEYFPCPPRKGLFVYLHICKKDGRFLDSVMSSRGGRKLQEFGSIDCPAVHGDVPPISYNEIVVKNLFKKNRGIQGHHNSCYLDATLFSMFAYTSVFDNLLNRPPTKADIDCYLEVQQILKEEIVNPLRHALYVRADRVMKLRTLLDKCSSVSGLTSEEKDPEEFLNSLLHQILKADPYLKLSSGQEAYFYQLFVEKNKDLRVPTVQQLFDQSFLMTDLKLKEIPSCLIIQMPRHGKQFKMYNRIFPSPVLDITDVLENSPRQCFICGKIAEYECRDCFYQGPDKFTMKAMCSRCWAKPHGSNRDHERRKLNVPSEFMSPAKTAIPRIQMELFAVVCIETSHYVAFVKCGDDSVNADVPWSFFDSMADRKGEQNGYNIPEVSHCTELSEWLTERGFVELEKDPDRPLPENVKRLFGDAYMCFYQSSEAMMYH